MASSSGGIFATAEIAWRVGLMVQLKNLAEHAKLVAVGLDDHRLALMRGNAGQALDDILVGDHDEIAGAGIGFHAGDDLVLLGLGDGRVARAAGRAPRRSPACGRRRHSRPYRGNGNNGWTVSARSWRRAPKSACRCGRPAGGPVRRARAASSSRRRRNWPDRAVPGDIAWRISTTCPPSRNSAQPASVAAAGVSNITARHMRTRRSIDHP